MAGVISWRNLEGADNSWDQWERADRLQSNVKEIDSLAEPITITDLFLN